MNFDISSLCDREAGIDRERSQRKVARKPGDGRRPVFSDFGVAMQ